MTHRSARLPAAASARPSWQRWRTWLLVAVALAAMAGLPVRSEASVGQVPNPPTNVAATTGDRQVTLRWSAPFFTNGTLTGYSVTPIAAGVAQPARSFASTATVQTISGLTNGTSYAFTVAATNATGSSAPSTASTPIVVGAPSSPPFPSAVPGDGQALVRWKAPAANGSSITSYAITPSTGGTALPTQTFAATATSQTIGGLVNGTSYTFAITATNGSGTGVAATTDPIVVGTPVAPATVSAVPGDGQAKVTWTAPSSANGAAVTGYVVTPYAAGVRQSPRTFTSTALSQTITNLSNGVSHTFTVAAVNARGTGPASALSAAIVVGAPTAPTSVKAVPQDAAAVVSWTAPSANGSPVTGYSVTPFVGSVAQPTRTFTSTATSQTITGLTNGTAMTFRVDATNARGTGPRSGASASVTIGATGTVPSAPARPTVGAGIASATVSWTPPASNGSAITSYVITPWRDGTALTATSIPAPATSGTVRNLVDGQVLTFTVKAVNGIGTGPASPASAPVTVGTPQAPTAVLATTGNGQATVRWAAPFFSNGTLTGYRVTPWVAGTAQASTTFASTATSQVITGLTNGTNVTFTVEASNAVGFGAASSPSPALVVGAPGIPAFPGATPGDGQATVRWWAATPNASPVTGYVVTPIVDGVARAATTFASTATQQVLTGFSNGSSVAFDVAGINASGTGLPGRTAAITIGAPVAPAAPTAAPGSGAAVVSWTAPSITNGAPVTGYTVTPLLGTTKLPSSTFTSTATTQTITGLTDGSAYTFTVAAVNARGTGPASGASAAVTVGAPAAPTGVQAVTANGSAVVSWTAPASNGAAVTGYAVTPYVGTTAKPTQVFASTATSQTLTGLTNGAATTFQVAATNARGTGPRSAASPTITIGVPAAPDAPTATAGDGQASVAWVAPAANGAPISSYLVTPWRDGRRLAAVVVPGDATSTAITGLLDGAPHTFTVLARNTYGSGASSPASGSITPGGVPAAPVVGAVLGDPASAALTWAAASGNGYPITGYEVVPWVDGVAGVPQAFAPGAAGSAQQITGLVPGTTYRFTVRASNVIGTGPASSPSDPVVVGAPRAPETPSIDFAGTTVTVRWNPPADNGAAISGYLVTPWVGGVGRPATVVSAPATSVTLSLVAGEPTSFTVAAINQNGTGAASPATDPVTAGTPGAPGTPTATAVTGGVTVSWPAAAANGSAITGYVVTPYVGTIAQRPFTSNGTGTSITLTALGTGVDYRFRVAATNAAGTGPASAPSAAVTMAHWFCLPGAPTTAAEVRTALNHHDRRWQGGDGGTAVALPDGRDLWLFGDSLVGTVQSDGTLTTGWGMVHGSALIQDGACFDPFFSATDTRPVSLIPDAPDGYFWPGDAWVSADGSQLNVLAQGNQTGIAVFRLPDLTFQRIDVLPPPPAPATRTPWRILAYRDVADGHVYLYDVEGFDHYAVRIPDTATSFTTTFDWEYWNGSGWALDPAENKAVAVTGTYAGLQVQRWGSGYVAVASGIDADAGTVVAWTAPTPAGPWTYVGKVADAPSAGGSSSSYGAHPVVLPGIEPLVVWSVSAVAAGTTTGGAIGVAPLKLAVPA